MRSNNTIWSPGSRLRQLAGLQLAEYQQQQVVGEDLQQAERRRRLPLRLALCAITWRRHLALHAVVLA